MRFRKLHIAFSATCLIACVLLIALWVRSYWWMEQVSLPHIHTQTVQVGYGCGDIAISVIDSELVPNDSGSVPNVHLATDEWLRLLSLDSLESPSQVWGAVMHGNGGFTVFIPFWFFVLVAFGISTVPWLRWRFSLRTLLITTTLVAVVLGLAVWAASQ
jgi:hypothetical protein